MTVVVLYGKCWYVDCGRVVIRVEYSIAAVEVVVVVVVDVLVVVVVDVT